MSQVFLLESDKKTEQTNYRKITKVNSASLNICDSQND